MTPATIALDVAGVLGVLFGLRCYSELRKWARLCQRVRIAIAHKRRVQLDAPLTEWVEWAGMLKRDEASRGRIIYRNGHVSVAILKPKKPKLEVVRPRLWARLAGRFRSTPEEAPAA